MQQYIIEDNINFYDELNNDPEDEVSYVNICQITGCPLIDKSVVLECNHVFNYNALYTEICRQKFDFKTYTFNLLSKKELNQVIQSKLDYFIKCPYCRNIQFSVLPYYPELGLKEQYGVNCTDNILYKYGIPFKMGNCCVDNCNATTITPINNVSYCAPHYFEELKNKRIAEKQLLIENKLVKKQELLDKKKELLVKKQELLDKKKELLDKKKEEKKILLENINSVRITAGLKALKRLPVVKTQ
jgi:hypothetical protein